MSLGVVAGVVGSAILEVAVGVMAEVGQIIYLLLLVSGALRRRILRLVVTLLVRHLLRKYTALVLIG